jgi:hypothetical protein
MDGKARTCSELADLVNDIPLTSMSGFMSQYHKYGFVMKKKIKNKEKRFRYQLTNKGYERLEKLKNGNE